ncbi:MAG TPA: glutamine synthetase family protein [Methanocorpusculum sp.]|nr:glutamine synthetase family protein [Methanocorpusculum sp.]
MNDAEILMNPNELVQYLKKSPSYFTKEDIVRYCEENGIKMVNFHYVGGDGKLKTLNFSISSKEYLETILSDGERVDGSNIFPDFIEAGSSDLYVIPRYSTAFRDPFADEETPTLSLLCSYYDNTGKPLASAPEYILKQAAAAFKKNTGMDYKCLGELEYYVIADAEEDYPAVDQKGYHESGPFCKFEFIRTEAMMIVAKAGGQIKYGHSEVGCFTKDGKYYEQHEIEFLPMPPVFAVEQLILAKWALRLLGYKYGVTISYAPKITVGKAGSGLHFHMLAEKNGRNVMVKDGALSDIAKRMIAGILDLGDAVTAFGNTIPTSYFRLVPHQEAPTYICWGDRNRSVVVRVPLGWTGNTDMAAEANFGLRRKAEKASKQTFEYRVADGSAAVYETVACLIVGAMHGLTMDADKALEMADKLYASGNIFSPEYKKFLATLKQLPTCCAESAKVLNAKRAFFEEGDIFPAGVIDAQIKKLQSYKDSGLSDKILGNDKEFAKYVEKYIHIA